LNLYLSVLGSDRFELESNDDSESEVFSGDFFNINFDNEDFPVTLLPGERYNFVVSLDPLPTSFTKNDHLNSTPEVHFTWRAPSLAGSMISPYRIPSPPMPSKKKLLISFDIENSPVKVHTLFPVHITVSNLSSQARDISIEVPLLQFNGDIEPTQRVVKGNNNTNNNSIRTSTMPIPERSRTSELLSRLAATQRTQEEINAAQADTKEQESTANDGVNSTSNTKGPIGEKSKLPQASAIAGIYGSKSDKLLDYGESKASEIGLVCLQKLVRIGTIEPRGKVQTTLQCIAFRDGLHCFTDIKIIDRKNNLVYVIQQPCEIFAEKN